jgi:uncharacterized protein YjbI with pentapeptide repeats
MMLLALVIGAGPAWACSCGGRTPDEILARAGIIFRGTLLSIETEVTTANCSDRNKWECWRIPVGVFSVEQVIKGELGEGVRIRMLDHDHQCGPTFRIGDSVTVMALGESEASYWVGSCMYAPSKGQRGFDALIEAAERHHGRLQALDDAIAQRPFEPDALLAKARFLSQTGTPMQALAVLGQLLQMEPLHRSATFLKADLHSRHGKEFDALNTLAPFLVAHPDDHEALRRQAISLARLNLVGAIPETWRDFSGLDQDHLDFSGRRLDKASFRGNRMYYASFAGADLREADLSGVNMWESDFSSANLAGAILTRAQINQRNFAGTNFQGADLRGASMIGDFTGVNLSSATASKSSWSSTVSFKGVKAVGLVADGSNFGDADFAGADFSGANFRGATVWTPRFAGANLSNTDFTGAKFVSRDGRMGDLSGADLSSAKLDGATFVSIQYDCTTKWPAGFNPEVEGLIPAADADACSKKLDFSWRKEPADTGSLAWYGRQQPFTDLDLSGVSFRGAWLPGRYFWKSDLRGADFTRAEGQADMRAADLRGADFSYANLHDWTFHGVENGPANLEGARFHGAILYLRDFLGDRGKSADLSKADLKGAIVADEPGKWPAAIDPLKAGVFFKDSATAASLFPGYSLNGTDLRGYDLFQFKFGALDLSRADLRGARLEQVDLSRTQLSGAKLKGACVYPSTPWPSGFDAKAAEIIYCSVMSYGNGHGGSDRSSAWAHSRGGVDSGWKLPSDTPVPNFTDENWDEIDWQAAWLPGTDMDGGSFVHTNLKGANLVGASMKDADLTGINLNDALLDGANLSNAKLHDADLRRTSFKEADLSGADLTGALYDDTTVWPAGFDPAAAGAVKQQ